jgi:peptide chain release factor
MRRDALEQSSVTDEVAFRNNLKVGREIADFLRKNIVQAERLDGEDNMETYSMFYLLFFA